MAIPNLISILVLSPVIKEEVFSFQQVIQQEKAGKKHWPGKRPMNR